MKKSITFPQLVLVLFFVLTLIFFTACDDGDDGDNGDNGDNDEGYDTVATPTFSLAEGTYSGEQAITISCTTSGATIYYTTDGSEPATNSIEYTGPINVSVTTTLKAISVKIGFINSEIASAEYIIDNVSTSVIKRDMVSVPGGTYTQTDTDSNSFSHTISGFQMAKYEVTYELWYTVYQWAVDNGYYFENAGREGDEGTNGAEPTEDYKYEPVTNINWRDIMVWCNAYSEMAGLNPCYTYNGDTIKDSRDSNGTACDNAVCDWEENGYRLPTEGEWQYAASYIDGSSWLPYNHVSGDTSSYCYPDDGGTSTVFGNYAWYEDNTDETHDVGTKT